MTNATDLALFKPLPSHTLQKRWQWTQYGCTIPTPWAVHSESVTNTVAVLDKLELIQEGAVAHYGPGGIRWLSTVGDLSAMYDEVDPALHVACDKAEEAISHLPEWTGKRSALWLNMSYHGGLVRWGNANIGMPESM